ncbi:MAG TPA: gephyrin-like molybdotransferase Glp [Candidatus Bathyarchaeia archaeon]|nr:gephyrin-like molybdotransferase Glp [Candidatus Bathyarchaeia archaeon]
MFRKLMTFEEAQRAIASQFKPSALGEEEAVLLEAYNRVLAEDVVSTLDIPPFSRSTMDGYAVKAEDTFGADENQPATLKVCGVVNIGEQPHVNVAKGEAVEIVTGAPIPEGANAVVMVEDTEREDSELHVFTPITPNENVMKCGSDIKEGEAVLKKGQILGSSEIGVLAALGLTKVQVSRIPVIAVLSTGGEVTEPGKPLPPGKIYDINAYSISTAVTESGGKPVYFGVVPDDKEALFKALHLALASADMVITSGGVSVGPRDYTPQIVDSLGKPGIVVYGIAVKPGKPTTVAFIGEKPVFSLPGHPTSALLIFYLLARPLIQQLAGRPVGAMKTIRAAAGSRMFSAKGRRTFVMVRLMFDKNCRLIADPVESGASGAITTLAKADGFVEIPENEQFVDSDQEVLVFLFRNVAGKV